jgi:xylulose-5-phosphate/fructose-6-phosphate phosphoketolase
VTLDLGGVPSGAFTLPLIDEEEQHDRRRNDHQYDEKRSLSAEELADIDGYWRAANYLSVGQIYLLDNPLLREPLRLEHVKPRLLGHWGTTPGLNFLYAHMNRVIKRDDLNLIYITGPGHGGPGLVANTYLEGTYTELYPQIGHDQEGLRRLFRQLFARVRDGRRS